jgi:prolyl 4-hydroxylase
MRGRFFANIFVHFEPLGTPRKPHDDFSSPVVYDAEALESMDAGLPPYVIPGTPWEDEWHSSFPDGWKLLHNDVSDGASKNDLRLVDNLYIKDPQSIHSVDTNGWSPLHEAARAGSVDVAKYLFERDVDINLKTGHGVGDSALDLARQYHGEDSEIFKFLFGVGAESGSESEL